jgi:antitoxin YefM
MCFEEDLKPVLSEYQLTVKYYREDNGSITAALKEMDLVVNGHDKESVDQLLLEDLIDYAKEYFNEFELYYNAPSRKEHLPYVLKALLWKDSVFKGGDICKKEKLEKSQKDSNY